VNTETAPENTAWLQELRDELTREVGALDIGAFTDDPRLQRLHRYMRAKLICEADIDRIKAEQAAIVLNCQAMIRERTNRLQLLDSIYAIDAENTAAELLHGKRAKSIKTPWGVAGFKTQAEHAFVVDEEEFLTAPVNVVPEKLYKREMVCKIDRKAVNEYVLSTGEVLPGVEIRAAREVFSIKTAPAKNGEAE
jgi:hypothetical protein